MTTTKGIGNNTATKDFFLIAGILLLYWVVAWVIPANIISLVVSSTVPKGVEGFSASFSGSAIAALVGLPYYLIIAPLLILIPLRYLKRAAPNLRQSQRVTFIVVAIAVPLFASALYIFATY